MNRDLPCSTMQISQIGNPLARFPCKSMHRGFTSRSVHPPAMGFFAFHAQSRAVQQNIRETNPCSAGSFLIYTYTYESETLMLIILLLKNWGC